MTNNEDSRSVTVYLPAPSVVAAGIARGHNDSHLYREDVPSRMVIQRFLGAIAAGAAVLALSAGTAQAQTINFDFEDQANTWNPPPARPGALVSFPYAKSGLTLTISRNQTSPFDIVNNANVSENQVKVAAFGARSLDPFVVLAGNDFFIFNLSSPVSSITLDYGDYGGDTDTGTLTAFAGANGTGANLGSDSNTFSSSVATTFNTLTVTTGTNNISSFTVSSVGSSGFNQSIFLDNIRVTIAGAAAAPEPGTVALLAPLALIGITTARRRFK
jgi:hypothetical protein